MTHKELVDMYLITEDGIFPPIYEYDEFITERDQVTGVIIDEFYTGFRIIKTAKSVYDEWLSNKDIPVVPDDIMTNNELTVCVRSIQEDTAALFDGVIEADNKATTAQNDAVVLFAGVIEADNKATSAQADTVALFDGLVDVDTRLSVLETSVTNTQEAEQFRLSIDNLNNKVNKILEYLKLNI